MKQLIWIIAALLLVACGSEEPTEPVAQESVPATEGIAENTADAAEELALENDEVIEVVEESASEPEAQEQPMLLAQTETPSPGPDFKYAEGRHYTRMVPTQPTLGSADKIEVAEFFWYGCPHCYDLEPYLDQWNADKPANVRFVRIPAMWNNLLKLHARLYYTEEVLVRNGVIEDGDAFHKAVFQEYHQRGNRLTSESSIQNLFERFGVSGDAFQRAWGSFEVSQKLRVAEDLARRYSIANVPTVVVNGKYRTGGSQAGSYPRLLEVIDELIVRETVR